MSTHDYFLRTNTKSRVLRRVNEMVAMYGGPEKVIGKPSATGVGVHIIFREDADEELSMPGPPPLPLPPAPSPEGEDVNMDSLESNMDAESMSSSSCSSSIPFDRNHAEPHAPRPENAPPTPTLDEPRACRRAGNSQPTGWTDGKAPSGESVDCNHVIVTKPSRVCHSDEALEAARQRVARQRRDDAERIRRIQERKLMLVEADLLRQRAADLEREAEEEATGLAGSNLESTVMEDDTHEVDSNYARTEVYYSGASQ
jgi:hypothetical protein